MRTYIKKKENRARAAAALLMLCLCLLVCPAYPAMAASDDGYGVYDDYGLLSEDEASSLTEKITQISDEYSFDTAILITEDVGEEYDYRDVAAEFMQEYNVGGDNGGLCIFHQPDARNITIVFRGSLQDDFDESIQDIMLDHCTEKLKADDPVGAYESLLSDLEKGLARVQAGKSIRPVDIEGGSVLSDILIYFLLSLLVMAVPTLCMTLYQVFRMKTKKPQHDANAYTNPQGLKLTDARDMFLYHTVRRTPKPRDDDHDGGGGGFSHGGESFSGSGRDY